MLLGLENNHTVIVVNDTTSSDGVSSMYYVDNIGDGDHQLRGDMSDIADAAFQMHYFE